MLSCLMNCSTSWGARGGASSGNATSAPPHLARRIPAFTAPVAGPRPSASDYDGCAPAAPFSGGAIIAGMDAPPLLLASASPRRRRLLAWLGLSYDVAAADTDEDLTGPLRRVPPVLSRSLAADKARAAASVRARTGGN